MIKKSAKNILRNKKHYRMRRHIIGTEVRPRLSVFRSEKHIYAQIIDDSKSMTLVSASTLDADVKAQIEKTNDTQAAAAVGKVLAERAAGKGITEVVFDRGGFLYH